MKIIVGLGNPGKKYEKTRHNAGFLVVDKLAAKNGLNWKQNKKASCAVAEYEGDLLIKPQTFMNNSGMAVQSILSYYKLLPKKWGLFAKEEADLTDALVVVHDDVDLPLGKYKTSTSSGSAGHKGVQSIIDHIKTKHFTRIRIGISDPKRNERATPGFVLQRFSSGELEVIDSIASQVILEKL
jgi:PTH1 family peptidyl-tRNA hydrolase